MLSTIQLNNENEKLQAANTELQRQRDNLEDDKDDIVKDKDRQIKENERWYVNHFCFSFLFYFPKDYIVFPGVKMRRF